MMILNAYRKRDAVYGFLWSDRSVFLLYRGLIAGCGRIVGKIWLAVGNLSVKACGHPAKNFDGMQPGHRMTHKFKFKIQMTHKFMTHSTKFNSI